MPTIEYQRPWLADYQQQALFSDERYGIVEGSSKAGKTAPCLIWLAEQAMAGRAGQNYWWVAPVYTQAEIAYRRMKRGLLDLGKLKTHDSDKWIDLPNGTRMWFKSGEKPDNLYGEDVYGAVIDEASRVREESWWAVRSTLTATRGRLRVIGNVKGRTNWFYQLARKAEAGEPGMTYCKVTAYDAVKAKILNADEVEQAKRDLPDVVFRELYLAEPADDGGNPFGMSAIASCVAPMSTAKPAVWGWDLAKSQDWTVGVALDVDGNVCRFERLQHRPWDAIMEVIHRATDKVPSLVDSTGLGDPILEMLQKRSGSRYEGFKFTSESKQKLMEGLAVKIQKEEISFPDTSRECPIRAELENFEYVVGRTSVRYSAPEGFHDDCVCALALAVSHLGHARQPIRISSDLLARSQGMGGFSFRV